MVLEREVNALKERLPPVDPPSNCVEETVGIVDGDEIIFAEMVKEGRTYREQPDQFSE